MNVNSFISKEAVGKLVNKAIQAREPVTAMLDMGPTSLSHGQQGDLGFPGWSVQLECTLRHKGGFPSVANEI